MSHTEKLVEEAAESSIKELAKSCQQLQEGTQKHSRFRDVGTFANTYIFHKIGLHITKPEIVNQLTGNIISPQGYWSYSGSFWSFLHKPNEWDKVYEMLSDDYSKTTFDWFIKYRTATMIAQSTIANDLYPFEPLTKLSGCSPIKKHILRNNFAINGIKMKGIELELLVVTFDYNQYSYRDIVKVSLGDTVIDAGAYRGDTALYFAPKIGKKGMVYAFEPDDENYACLEENIQLNHLTNIKAIKAGVGSKSIIAQQVGTRSGVNLRSIDDSNGKVGNIKVYSIDDFMLENKINRVDFIKMDIEGWELDALKGAEKCLKNCKPKLAICVYHKPEDLLDIANYLKIVVPEYKLYLEHKSSSWGDTILYARI